jgi:hypothetical protein
MSAFGVSCAGRPNEEVDLPVAPELRREGACEFSAPIATAAARFSAARRTFKRKESPDFFDTRCATTQLAGGADANMPARVTPRLASTAAIFWTASSKPSLPKVLSSMSSNKSPISSSCFFDIDFFQA